MSYLFSGRLRVHSCGGSLVPLADATVKLYRRGDEVTGAFAVLSADDVSARDYALFAQGRTDEQGEFQIPVLEKSVYGYRGSTHPYAGEPFVVDVVTRGAYGLSADGEVEPVQFTLAPVEPAWSDAAGNQLFRWEHDIADAQWTAVRTALDIWTIVGRVKGAGAGYRVAAYDADLIQDDHLGTATTDADGRFRIDYPGTAFRETIIGASLERGGPEVYFRVEDQSGAVVLQEPKSRGSRPDRARAPNCLVVELNVDAGASV